MNSIIEIGNLGEQKSNPAYIKDLILVRKTDVIEIENPSIRNPNGSYQVTKNMFHLVDNAVVYRIKYLYRTCSFNENSVMSRPRSYTNSISFEVSAIEDDFVNWLMDNEGHEFIALFAMRNFKIYVSGNENVALDLSYERLTQQKSGYRVNLSANLSAPCRRLEGVDLDSFFDNFEFSAEFNFEDEFN